jgi:hypothetical protein
METEIDITGTLETIEIGATGRREIIQNVKTILSTVKGSVPLDREFGIKGDYVDQPMQVARALYAAEIVEEVEKQEPRVKVTQVTWGTDDAMDGKMKPIVRIKVKEGVL